MQKLLKALPVALFSLLPAHGALADNDARTAADFSFTSIDGQPMPLSAFNGKVLLVVNTASLCGFTPQYTALQALHEAYEKRGFVVIGVPSNDFGGQEPGDAAKVKEFCTGTYGVTFPLTAKEVVSGAKAHPFYLWAKETLGSMNAPWWNFHKYLVGRDGKLVTAFLSTTSPESNSVKEAIEAELDKPAPLAATN